MGYDINFENGKVEVMFDDLRYNGWKNFETWNVALWLGNDFPLYRVASGYAKYASPYLSLRDDLMRSMNFRSTKDGISLWDRVLDIKALDAFLQEMVD
jgi:hypothetical protein